MAFSLYGLIPVASTAGVASLVLKATPGNFYSVTATNLTTTAGFLVVLNATAAPTTGSTITPLEFAALPASGTATIDRSQMPDAMNTGVVVLVTSAATPYTFTSGTITAAISGRVQ